MILTSAVALAESHVKTIREDRYWVYNCYGIGYSEDLIMKFDGTAEVFGKEYHVFKIASLPGQETRSNGLDIKGTLLREEDGKVYVANMSYGCDKEYRKDSEYADYESEEFLLFDFNCKEGDYMPSVLNDFNSDIRYGDFSNLVFYPSKNQIKKIEYIDIDGEKYRKYSFGETFNPEVSDFTLEWPELIEGVGFMNHGILSLPMFLSLPAGGPFYNIEFGGLFDEDGKLIYPKPVVGVDKLEATGSAVSISYEGDQILISAESGNFDVTICSMEGKSLRNYRGNGCLRIDKNDFNKGIYILTLKCGNRFDTRKIIITK